MINPLNFYKTYTTFDGTKLAFISLFIIGGVMIHAYLYTKSKRVQIVNVFSWLAMELIFMLSILIARNIFEMQMTIMIQAIYFGILLLQAMNLMLLTDFFNAEVRKKGFDIDHISRKHYNFTLNFAILIALTVSAGAIFMNTEFTWIIVTLGIDAIVLLALTHLFVRTQLNEPFVKPKLNNKKDSKNKNKK